MRTSTLRQCWVIWPSASLLGRAGGGNAPFYDSTLMIEGLSGYPGYGRER